MMHFSLGRLARCTVALAAAGVLAGCAPLVVGGVVVGGTLVATDRRTTGTQVEDQTIELKAADRVKALAIAGGQGACRQRRGRRAERARRRQ